MQNSETHAGFARGEKSLLTGHEMEIVQHVAQGFQNKVNAKELFISENTVKNHLHNNFDKLGVSDRLELVLYAIHHRLIDKQDRTLALTLESPKNP